ncbi:uncharacterized protein N7458_011568 [Penicillium daleae]|uniref:Uncharacterized protein n=1 Tax=Penicillium daleae TaxID=63821 RepID=A0AAD6BSI5_9EURO|nr:uncharacterized protein N7458_011568 [Penicillium daleae]KAJ5432412.1 hypothetical protein N7458_011568 [Penicillium daleae]
MDQSILTFPFTSSMALKASAPTADIGNYTFVPLFVCFQLSFPPNNYSHPPPSRTNAQYPIVEFNAECRTGPVLGLQKARRPPEDPASRFLTDNNPRFCPSLRSVASPVRNGRRTLCGNMPLPPDSTP